MAQKNLSTQTAQKKTRRNFTQTNLYTHTYVFPHRNLYSQKSLCTTFFSQALLHTDAFTQKKQYYTQKLVHTARFYTVSFYYTGVLFPFFDHLPFVFPFSIIYIYHIFYILFFLDYLCVIYYIVSIQHCTVRITAYDI